jgi:hypothetical protein
LWICDKLEKVNQAISSVPISEEIVRQFAMFSLGVFPQRKVLPRLLGTFFERVWKVLNIHAEFHDLTTSEKREILKRNCQVGIALMFIRNDNQVLLQIDI